MKSIVGYKIDDILHLLCEETQYMKRMGALNELSSSYGKYFFEDRDLVEHLLSFTFVRKKDQNGGVIKEFAQEIDIGYRRARRINKIIEETHLTRRGPILFGSWPDEDSDKAVMIRCGDGQVALQVGPKTDVLSSREKGKQREGTVDSPISPEGSNESEYLEEDVSEETFANEKFKLDENRSAEEEVENKAPDFDEEESKIEDWAFNDDVMYVEQEDEYIYYSDKARKNIRMPGEVVREMKTDYSSQGGRGKNHLTINEIARKYEIPRKYIIELKKKFGWTHDSSIYTEEELVDWDTDQIDERAVEARERKALERAQRKRSREIEQKARKWDNFYFNALKPLISAMREHESVDTNVPKININTSISGDYAGTFCPMDMHFGKNGWSMELNGEGYSREEAEDLLLGKTHELADWMKLYDPSRIFVPIGHDFFHVSNFEHKTGNGTPQDVDGTYTQIVMEGCNLGGKMIELLRPLADVDVVWVPGNHDPESSMTAAIFLAARYEDAEDVNVHLRPGIRTYIRWRNNLMGHIHRSLLKDEDLVQVMANEVRKTWGKTKNSMWFSGHYHSEKTKDVFGTHIFQAPTLCGKGRWDFKKGYSARRSMDSYMIHEEAGKVSQHSAPLVEESDPSLLVDV